MQGCRKKGEYFRVFQCLCTHLFPSLHLASCHQFRRWRADWANDPSSSKAPWKEGVFQESIPAYICTELLHCWEEMNRGAHRLIRKVNTTFFCWSFRLGAGRCNQGNTTNHLNVTLSACLRGLLPTPLYLDLVLFHSVVGLCVCLISRKEQQKPTQRRTRENDGLEDVQEPGNNVT